MSALSKLLPINILRASGTVGGMTLLSRFSGFIRDIMIAAALGTGAYAEIFVIAFRLPNLFRRLFAEGAFSAAFLPSFARRFEEGGQDGAQVARQFASEIFSVFLFFLIIFTALAQIFMPWLVTAIAQGFRDTPAKFELTVYFSRISFFYLIFMSLIAFFAAMLNARGRFFAAAAAPIILNVVLVGSLILAAYLGAMPLVFLIWGVAIAGLLQFLWVLIDVLAHGLGIKILRPRLTPDVKHVAGLAIPGILAAGIGQINLLVGTSIATAAAGAAAVLYYADRLYQLPMGVIGVALSVVLLPTLTRHVQAGDGEGARAQQNRAIDIAMFFTLPAALGLFMLAHPIVALLFERGAFTRDDSETVALAVRGFCVGLPAFVLIRAFQPAFFAREDTKSPLIDGAIGVAVNIILSLIFFRYYGVLAIALATSIAGWVNFSLMLMRSMRRGFWHMDSDVVRKLSIQFCASLIMGGVLWYLLDTINIWTLFSGDNELLTQIFNLFFMIMMGFVVYVISVLAFTRSITIILNSLRKTR